MVDEKSNLIVETRAAQMAGKGLSDNVIIEIVHAFKDILIEYIDKKYQVSIKQ